MKTGIDCTTVSEQLDLEGSIAHSLLVGISRITKEQAAQLPNKTQPIPGDDGYYISELDVFHNLHCLVCYILSKACR